MIARKEVRGGAVCLHQSQSSDSGSQLEKGLRRALLGATTTAYKLVVIRCTAGCNRRRVSRHANYSKEALALCSLGLVNTPGKDTLNCLKNEPFFSSCNTPYYSLQYLQTVLLHTARLDYVYRKRRKEREQSVDVG